MPRYRFLTGFVREQHPQTGNVEPWRPVTCAAAHAHDLVFPVAKRVVMDAIFQGRGQAGHSGPLVRKPPLFKPCPLGFHKLGGLTV